MPLILNGTTGISGVDGSAGTPSYVGADTDTGVLFPAANTLALSTGGTERMRIDSSGNVGIGTSSPLGLVDIVSSSSAVQRIRSTANTGANTLYQNSGTGTTTGDGLYIGIDTAAGYLWNFENQPVILATNNTERMRIDSSGNVGIGSTSPLSKLEVVGGQFRVANTSTAAVCIISTDSTSTNGVTVESSYYGGAGYGPMKFNTGGSERMRITSNGTVIVAATSSSFDTTYSVLQISSTGALANYAPTGDVNITSGLYYASGEWKYTTTGLKGSRFQVASQGIQAIAGTNASPTAGGSVTQSTILYLTYNNTLALQDATQSAGTGIAFPATQNASSNANTLDDYEEGTFTVTIAGSSTAGTANYSAQTGRYTKIGRLVYIEIYINWDSGTGSGGLRITNLPFTSASSGTYPSLSIGWFNSVALSANNIATAFVGNNETQIYFYQYPTGGGGSGEVPYDVAGAIQIAGCYTV